MKTNNKMSSIISKFSILLLCFTIIIGCDQENPYYSQEEENGNESTENVGFLSVSDLELIMDTSTEEYEEEPDARVKTRSTDVDIDTYQIVIVSKSTSESVYSGTYGELKALLKPLSLQPGDYIIRVISVDNIPLVDWDNPTYGAEREFNIVKKETTTISNLICTLSNIKTTVSLSADLKELFLVDTDVPLSVSLSLGDSDIVYGREETRAGFFKAVENENTLEVLLSGMYNISPADQEPNYVKIEGWKQAIPKVKAGQWRKIFIKIENANSGNIKFVVTVETWMYDAEIDVDVMESSHLLVEEEIEDPDDTTTDPNSAVVTLDNHNIANPFNISASIFDFDAEICSDVIKAFITPTVGSTVKSIDVIIDSDNTALMGALNSAGYIDNKITMLPSNEVNDYVTINQSNSEQIVATVKYSGMKMLYSYEGTHVILIKIVDTEGRRSFTPLTIKVVNDGSGNEGGDEGPSIVWNGGYEFNKVYNITADNSIEVDIDITSTTGISGFIVKIISQTLTPEELQGLSLATEMDLINPATPEMETSLEALSFPIKDAVKGKKSLNFNITSFMPMLVVLGGGTSEFELHVTDASGKNMKIIKVNVPE